jgi:SNF2 family DNA or RNA helicase
VTVFVPKGPPRFDHQKRGLMKMIQTGGVTALLFDPGLGKTATVLDYCSLLAMKASSGEARVLVVCPLAAVDTWVMQSEMYVHDDVNIWAEALGGSIRQRAQALSSRGGNPTRGTPKRGRRDAWQGPRAAWHSLSWARHIRCAENPRPEPAEGPDGLGNARPRLVLEVINLDTLSSRARVGSGTMADVMVDAIRRFSPDLVVVDESHKIKGVRSNASMLLSRVSDYVKRRVLLTGTVMPHSPLDVFAQWRFLAPYAFGTKQSDGTTRRATFSGFQGRFAVLGGWMGKEVIGFRDLDVMQNIMAQNAIVARKEDALPDLPKTTTAVVPVMLTAAEKQAYKDMADNLVISMPTVTATSNNRLTQMLRLRQITSGHIPDDSGVVRQIGKSKVDTIRSLVHDTLTGEKRIVIFAFFTEEIRMLEASIREKGTEVMVIAGGTGVEDRLAMRKRFGVPPDEDPTRMVMIAQVKTMSLAVNELVTANHAIFASLSQQRDDLIQAEDRLDRIGQTRPVTFWYALAPGTVDEVIMQSHKDRTDLEDAMLKHIQQVHEQGLLAAA